LTTVTIRIIVSIFSSITSTDRLTDLSMCKSTHVHHHVAIIYLGYFGQISLRFEKMRFPNKHYFEKVRNLAYRKSTKL